MVSRISQWTLDVQDSARMATFWSRVLDYRIDSGEGGHVKLYPPDDAPPNTPTVWLQACAEDKSGKNRNHPDLNVVADDYDVELQRLLDLGATLTDVGQKDTDPFTVLADPEGNEFCLLKHEPRLS